MSDRMFRTLVLGGIGLVGCGGRTVGAAQSNAGEAGPAPGDASYTPVPVAARTSSTDASSPSEIPPPPDPGSRNAASDATASGADIADAAFEADVGYGVPIEGPPPPK